MAILRTPNTPTLVGITNTFASSATDGVISPGFPAGYTPVRNDVHVIHLVGQTTVASNAFVTPSGYTLEEERYQLVVSGVYLAQAVFAKVLVGGDTSPTILVPASFNFRVLMATATVWSKISRSPVTDSIPGLLSTGGVGNTGGTSSGSPSSYTITTSPMTTDTTMVWVFSGTNDNNIISTNSPFVEIYSRDTTVGTDASSVFATRAITSGSTFVTFIQTVNFPDVYVANELQVIPAETVTEELATASGQGSGTATGIILFSASGFGVGTGSATASSIHFTNATGSGVSSQSVSKFATAARLATGSGVSSSLSIGSNGSYINNITLDSSGYLFYEYFDIILISPVFSSSFSVSAQDNATLLLSPSVASNFDIQQYVNVDHVISANISISCVTSASATTAVSTIIDPEDIVSTVSMFCSYFDILRPGFGEDTSDIKPFFMLDDIPLTEHNRKTSISAQTLNINSSNWKGKKSVYYKIQPSKRVFTFQWTFVPGKRENTVDLNAGRDYIYNKSTDPSDHVLKIRNLDTNGLNPHTTEVYNVLVAEYNESLVRRDLVGDDYYWDCTLSLKEV